MKRLLPILLCFLAFAAPRLYGQKTYPVTFSATEGGTLTAQALNPWVNFQSGDQLVAGTNLNFTASANKGYQLEYWEINGERSDLTDYAISLYNLQAPLNVVAHFKTAPTDGYKIHMSVIGEGEMTAHIGSSSYWGGTSVKDGEYVPAGSRVAFEVTPKSGKTIGYWTINGKKDNENYGKKEVVYTVIAETTMSVEIVDPVYNKVTFEATEGATIAASANWRSINSGDDILRGTEVTFDAEFNPDYKLDYWEVNGNRYNSNSIKYKVMEDTHVKLVARQKDKFPVNFSAEANGEVAAFFRVKDKNYNISFSEITTGEVIAEESQLVLLAKPNEGYHLVGWTLAGDTIGKGNVLSYKVTNGDNTIVAHFATGADTESVPVHFSAGEGGRLTGQASIFSPSYVQFPVKEGFPVKVDTRVTFTAIPDSLYLVKSWSVNDKNQDYYKGKKEFSYNFKTEDKVHVEFERFTPSIITFEASPAEGGSVEVRDFNYENVKSGYPVPEGSKISVSARPNLDYTFDYWEVNGRRSDHYTVSKISDYPVWDNLNFKAYFRKIVKLPVTFSANGDGSVEGKLGYWGDKINSNDIFEEGTTLYFTATANAEAKLNNWTINGVDTLAGKTQISYVVQKDKPNTIVANFTSTAAPKAVVTFTYDGKGELACTDKLDNSPVTSGHSIPIGKILKFVATPATGYSLSGWTINGKELYPNQTSIEYTVVEGTNDITAHFKQDVPTPNKVKVTYGAATEGGEVSALLYPASGIFSPIESGDEVDYDSNIFFETDIKPGYEVEKWVVNNEEATYAGKKNGLTIVVKENTDVQVYFKKIAPVAEYAVTFSADPAEGGKVKATGYIGGQYKIFKTGETVPDGSFIDFEAVANEGYEFEKFAINGADVTPDSANPNKLSQKISGETNIVAHFKSVIPKITITYTAGERGKFEAVKVQKEGEDDVLINSGDKVEKGAHIVFSVTPDKGYMVDKWFVNGEEVHSKEANSYNATFDESSEVKVTFRKPKLTLATAEGGKIVAKVDGTEVPNLSDVALGAKVSIEATPKDGYELTALTANDKDILAAKSFEMKGDTEVKAVFTKKALPTTYKVTLKYNDLGTISIKEQVDLNAVPEGTKLTVVAKGANDKCELKSLTANGKDILKDKTFTVTKDTEVVAVFVDHTGLDAVATQAFSIYPNPARESATVAGLAPESVVALYTLDGQLITRLTADRLGRLQINLSALSDGTYLVVTEGATQRLVVQH